MTSALKWKLRKNFSDLGLSSMVEKSQLFTQFFFSKLHEPEFVVFRDLISDKPVLDIGANSGQSAISIYNANSKLKIVSFEPNKLIVGRLNFTKALLGSHFDFRSIGLGDADKTLKMYIPVSSGVMLSQEGTLDRNLLTEDPLTRNRIHQATGKEDFEIIETEMQLQMLDALEYDPSALKIDVQGLELQVLKGGVQTLRKSKPLIMVESVPHNDEITDFLSPFGYQRYGFDSATGKLVPKLDRAIEHKQNWFYVHELAKDSFR